MLGVYFCVPTDVCLEEKICVCIYRREVCRTHARVGDIGTDAIMEFVRKLSQMNSLI
jgi:hypothetical protein